MKWYISQFILRTLKIYLPVSFYNQEEQLQPIRVRTNSYVCSHRLYKRR